MIDVTVIVVSWNVREYLRKCLESVYQTTRNVSFEVICVDNASEDGSVEMVRRQFPDVRVIENTENKRFIMANNQAISIAQGRYVLLLNSDTIVLENAIGKTVEFADRHPAGAAFGCKVLNDDMSLQHSCFMYPSPLNSLLFATYLHRLFRRSRFYGRRMMTWWDHGSVRKVEAISGCYSLVRRTAIEDVGLMDPIYYLFGDDIDWCFRFRHAGWSVYYFPGARIIHYGGRATAHMGSALRLQLFGSALIFTLLHRGKGAFFLARGATALVFLLRLPWWAVGAALSTIRRRRLLEATDAAARGLVYSLFAWKRLLMNRTDIRDRLENALRGRHETRTPPAAPREFSSANVNRSEGGLLRMSSLKAGRYKES